MELKEKIRPYQGKLFGLFKWSVRTSVEILYPVVYLFTGLGALFLYLQNITSPEAFLPELSMISFTVGMFILIFGVETKDILGANYFEKSVKISLGFLITGAFFMVLMLSTPVITELDFNDRSHNLTGMETIDNFNNDLSEALVGLFFAINVIVPIVGLGFSTWYLLSMLTQLVFEDLDKLISGENIKDTS